MQESVIRWDYTTLDPDCYKYSFFEEDKLKLERCVPYPPSGWYDSFSINISVYQRIK